MVFLSELDEQKIENPADAFKVGEERMAKILKMNPRDKKISLSFRQAQADLQKQDYQRYVDSQDDRMTLGELMGDKFKLITAPKKAETKPEEKPEEKAEEKAEDKAAAPDEPAPQPEPEPETKPAAEEPAGDKPGEAAGAATEPKTEE